MITTELTVTRPRLHSAQLDIVSQAVRYNVIACGRRFGKSTLGARLTIDSAMVDGHTVGWFAPTYKLITEAWRELRSRLAPAIERANAQERRIELLGGGTIEFWTLDNPDAGRSRGYHRVVIDEAGLVRNLEQVWDDAIRPTLVDYGGDAWFLGTPKGRNYFWSLYQRGLDDHQASWLAFQRPSAANPYLPPGEIPHSIDDALARNIPERTYRQEYLAEFIEDGAGVFRRVREAVRAEKQAQRTDGHDYGLGVDWGKHNDFTVITVMDMTTRSAVAIDRFNQIDYQLQLGRLRTLHERFQPLTILAERNSMGEPLIEQLQREGLPVQPFQTTAQSKSGLIEQLSIAFERDDIAIPDEPVLIGELEAFEAERLPSGMLRYSAPSGMHDDTVMSLALGWQTVVDHGSDGVWFL